MSLPELSFMSDPMSPQMLLVFALLGATVILFASERVRLDLTALLLLLALLLSGILTPTEALAGFADPVVLTIAGLFVVGGGLTQTGVAHALGQWLSRITRGGEAGLIVLVMISVAVLSAFMSTAGATAIFIPIVVSLGWSTKVSPSKLLLPLAVGSLIGGMLTLIGTPPNLVVSGQLAAAGLPAFRFFDYTPVGLVMLVVGVGFMVLVGRHWLPDRSRHSFALADERAAEAPTLQELAAAYALPGHLFRVQLRPTSALVGQTLAELNLRARYHVTVLELRPWQAGRNRPGPAQPVEPGTVLNPYDILNVHGLAEPVALMTQREGLDLLPNRDADGRPMSQELGMVELLLTPRSRLIGRTLQESRFRDKYGVTVLGIMRLGRPIVGDLATARLRFGDTLLVHGPWEKISLLREETRDFVMVGQPRELLEHHGTPKQAAIALLIMVGMLILITLEILPAVTAVLLAAIAMVLTRCLTMEDAYTAMNWASVVLLAGTLPLATALQKTGGVQLIAGQLTASLGQLGPHALLAGFFVLTSVLSQFISNTATTVLLAPIALQAALSLGLAPQPFLMAVAIAASTSFSTPVASLSNTLVLGPGGYHFSDFLKIGTALQTLMLVATLIVVPLLFPF